MNVKGMTLIETVVAMVISSLVALSVGTLILNVYQFQFSADQLGCLSQYRDNILAHLNRDQSWENTRLDATNRAGPFSCFPGLTGCASGAASAFRVLDSQPAGGVVIFDPIADPNSGVTFNCQPCTPSNTAICPISFDITYDVAGTPTNNPDSDLLGYYAPLDSDLAGQIIIRGRFSGNFFPTGYVIDYSRYDFNLGRYAK